MLLMVAGDNSLLPCVASTYYPVEGIVPTLIYRTSDSKSFSPGLSIFPNLSPPCSFHMS